MKIEILNHLALIVRDAQKTAEFYQRYCGMEVIHSREDGDFHIKWVRHPEQKDGFMLVLLETLAESTASSGNMDHLGIYVKSRADVDEIANLARADGILMDGPAYAGEIVGYYCMVQDPDGNLVEFSCEQKRI
jgi:lactoylglutathione lyase